MRKKPTLAVAGLMTALAGAAHDDALVDAAEHLLRTSGLRRWSMEDVADRAGVGRTTVYRQFGNRDELVHAVLARELRRTLAAVAESVSVAPDLESKAVAAVITSLTCLEGSVVDQLLRSDPATFLPFLTTDAGPLLDIARAALTPHLGSPELAESAARMGLSFVLTRHTVLPVEDPVAMDAAVRRLVRPFLPA